MLGTDGAIAVAIDRYLFYCLRVLIWLAYLFTEPLLHVYNIVIEFASLCLKAASMKSRIGLARETQNTLLSFRDAFLHEPINVQPPSHSNARLYKDIGWHYHIVADFVSARKDREHYLARPNLRQDFVEKIGVVVGLSAENVEVLF